MKRHIYILFFALLLASCVKSGEVDGYPNTGTDTKIAYSTWVVESRAEEANNAAVQRYGFSVSAYLDSDIYGFQHYFDAGVDYTAGWVSDNPQYWTSTGAITFDALSYDETTLGGGNGAVARNGRTVDYTCSPAIGEQVDLLGVSKRIENKKSAMLRFEHLLSQIKFSVDFSATEETNVTLTKINVIYHNIHSEATYTFGTAATTDGVGSWSLGDATLGDGYAATSIDSTTKEMKSLGDDMIFEPTNALMIIPQSVVLTESTADTDRYMSVSVEYTLNSGEANSTSVTTGTMELPAPTETSGSYLMGKAYTYNIEVNGDKVSIGLSIGDAEPPIFANGNLDLGLIEEALSFSDYNVAIGNAANGDTNPYLYYTAALRAYELFSDEVRNIVLYGSFEADHLGDHDGKLGYYCDTTGPFNIAAQSLGMMPTYTTWVDDQGNVNKDFADPLPANLFSVDLRHVTNFPKFSTAHSVVGDNILDPDAQVLAEGLFKDSPLLHKVLLPKGLKAIDRYAFQNCMSLYSIDLAEVTHIEDGAFVDCVGLVEVLGNSLTRIHPYGFDDCKSLERIDLSKVTQIDSHGFVECAALNNVNISSLTILGDHAFDGCTNLTICEDSEIPVFDDIAEFAFSGCSKLGTNGKRIDLTTTKTVGDEAFNGCTKLLLSAGRLENLWSIGKGAFAECELIGSIFDVELPAIEILGVSAFEKCPAINIVSGLERVEVFPDHVFQGCSSLMGAGGVLSLTAATEVGVLAFNSSGVKSIVFDKDNLKTIGAYAFDDCQSLTSLSGIEGVTSVGALAFAGSSGLTELDLSSATSVGEQFIGSVNKLTKLILPNVVSNVYYDENGEVDTTKATVLDLVRQSVATMVELNLESLEIESFPSWTSWSEYPIKKINISNCKGLAENAFAMGVSLEEVIAPSVETIGENAFFGCNALKVLDLSGYETSFPAWNFPSGCKSLVEVYIPKMPTIENGVFNGCSSLEILDASGATSIGPQSFIGCTSLKELHLGSVSWDGVLQPNSWDNPFDGTDMSGCTLYLSPEEYAANVSGLTWYGTTWGAIVEEL